MTIQSVDVKRMVMIRIDPGDDVLAALDEAVASERIQNGMIVNGLGSSRSHHYHVVASNELPPKELFPQDEAPRDIVSFSGLIIDGRVHAHVCFTDDEKAEGGHLEPGTRALTFAIVAIADFGDQADFAGWDSFEMTSEK